MSTSPDTHVLPDGPLGRGGEAALVHRFLHAPWPRPPLLIAGEAGIGKSTLWRHAVDACRAAGVRVLETSASEAESDLALTGLIDLFDGVVDEVLDDLSDVQREALEVAFLRRRASSELPKIALSSAVLAMLRALARDSRVLIAVDDLQWLEDESLSVVTYALRRLRDEPVAALATVRTPSAVDPAAAPPSGRSPYWDAAERLEVGGLDPAALRELLRSSGAYLTADQVRQVWERTGGNPLWAAEIAASLREGNGPAGDEIPLPQSVATLLRDRVATLAPPARQALTVVAALGRPAPKVVRCVLKHDDAIPDPDAAIDEAVESGVFTARQGRLVPTHPLLATAAVTALAPGRRRQLHGHLALVVTDVEARALHLEQSREPGPDEDIAAALHAAAQRAADRGAPHAAAKLAEHAVRRTAADDPARAERLLDAATWHYRSGEFERVHGLLAPVPDLALPPRRFALATLLLADSTHLVHGAGGVRTVIQAMLDEIPADDPRRAVVDGAMVATSHVSAEQRMEVAERAIAGMERDGFIGPLLHRNYVILADERLNAGEGVDESIIARMEQIEEESDNLSATDLADAQRVTAWRVEDVGGARQALGRCLAYATEVGEDYELGILYAHAALAELTGGDYARAASYLDRVDRALFGQSAPPPVVMSALGMLYLGQGRFDEIEGLIEEHTSIKTQRVVYRTLYAHALRGLAAARTERWDDAVTELTTAMGISERLRAREPGKRLRIDADLAEAYVAVGRQEDAERIAAYLHRLGARHRRPVLTGAAARIRGLIAASEGELARAEELLTGAVATLEGTVVPLELARALLELGRVRRRRRARGSARETLERARHLFELIGDVPFERRAAAEIERLAPARAVDGLTETERRVSDLVATGVSNREVAAAMFVSVRTVESHLGSIYRKLGVRSRAELLAVLLAGPDRVT